MEQLTETVHRILSVALKPGDIAIDATAGNGHDTLFLANAVGPMGLVYAFDVQLPAIETTRRRVQSAGWENVRLIQADHADLVTNIPTEYRGQIAAVVFNLGYLPGSDKRFVTQTNTTTRAITQGLQRLKPQGVMTILAYTGHPGGLDEALAVERLLQTLSSKEFGVDYHIPKSPNAPRLSVVTRREKSDG